MGPPRYRAPSLCPPPSMRSLGWMRWCRFLSGLSPESGPPSPSRLEVRPRQGTGPPSSPGCLRQPREWPTCVKAIWQPSAREDVTPGTERRIVPVLCSHRVGGPSRTPLSGASVDGAIGSSAWVVRPAMSEGRSPRNRRWRSMTFRVSTPTTRAESAGMRPRSPVVLCRNRTRFATLAWVGSSGSRSLPR